MILRSRRWVAATVRVCRKKLACARVAAAAMWARACAPRRSWVRHLHSVEVGAWPFARAWRRSSVLPRRKTAVRTSHQTPELRRKLARAEDVSTRQTSAVANRRKRRKPCCGCTFSCGRTRRSARRPLPLCVGPRRSHESTTVPRCRRASNEGGQRQHHRVGTHIGCRRAQRRRRTHRRWWRARETADTKGCTDRLRASSTRSRRQSVLIRVSSRLHTRPPPSISSAGDARVALRTPLCRVSPIVSFGPSVFHHQYTRAG